MRQISKEQLISMGEVYLYLVKDYVKKEKDTGIDSLEIDWLETIVEKLNDSVSQLKKY